MKFSDDVVSGALFARHAIRSYPFPGLDKVEFGMRMLHGGEIAQIRVDAVAYVKERRIDLIMDPEFLDLVISRMTLLAACFDLSDAKPFFGSLEQVLRLDAPLARTLYELYLTHCQTFDPLTHSMTVEEVNTVIAQLGKSETGPARLSLLGPDLLLIFAISMAHRLREK